jgi:uncharacterized protein (DUF1330 family)
LAAYFIVNLEVNDAATFGEYRTKVAPIIAQYGGRYIVRGGAIEQIEGNLALQRLVILEFPTLDAARNFYRSAEYAPLLKMRIASTISDIVLVEGYAGE